MKNLEPKTLVISWSEDGDNPIAGILIPDRDRETPEGSVTFLVLGKSDSKSFYHNAPPNTFTDGTFPTYETRKKENVRPYDISPEISYLQSMVNRYRHTQLPRNSYNPYVIFAGSLENVSAINHLAVAQHFAYGGDLDSRPRWSLFVDPLAERLYKEIRKVFDLS